MAKCDHCHTRKGKRPCPFLKGHICSTCCGENRGVRFDCPRDCPYFGPPERAESAAPATARAPGAPGGATQAPAAGGRRAPAAAAQAELPGEAAAAPDLSRYQRFLSADKRALADLMARIEFILARYDRGRRGLTDADVVAGLEYLRRRSSPILAVERFAPELGVFLEKALAEMYRGAAAPGPYDLIEVLDHMIATARNFGPPAGRRYLEQAALLEERSRAAGGESAGAAEAAPGPRIILPR